MKRGWIVTSKDRIGFVLLKYFYGVCGIYMRLLGLLKDASRNKRNVVIDYTKQMKLNALHSHKKPRSKRI